MSFSEILIFLLKRKKYSICIPVLAGIFGFILAWMLPEYYKSEIRVIVNAETKAPGLSSLMSNATSSGLLNSIAGFGDNSLEGKELYLEIVAGRDVNLATIEKFRLDTIYKGAKYKETLLKKFFKDIKIVPDELTGVISCSYEATNKVLARDLVRFIVEDANAKYINIKQERALQTIEQLNSFKKAVMNSVDSLSQVLVNFYKENNILHLSTQLQMTISTLAGFEEQIKSFKLSENAMGSQNSTAAELRKRKEILEREIRKLRNEAPKDYVPNRQSIYVNTEWAVEKLIEQEKLETDLKRLFLTLEMIESNIVTEESNAIKNLPVIQVVQDAYLPDYKSKPKRAIWAIISLFIAEIIVCSILILRGILKNEIPYDEEKKNNYIKLFKALLP